MYTIKVLPHTADLRIQIQADSIEEIFLAGLMSMGNILLEDFCDNEHDLGVSHTMAIHSVDQTTLLIDFLSDALTASYHQRAVFCRLDILEISDTHIKATIFGADTSHFDEDIKAVTYHEADVHQVGNGGWKTNVIFDI